MAWKKIVQKGDIQPGKGRSFVVDERQIVPSIKTDTTPWDDLCMY